MARTPSGSRARTPHLVACPGGRADEPQKEKRVEPIPTDHVCRGRACIHCLIRRGGPIPAAVLTGHAIATEEAQLCPDVAGALTTVRRFLRYGPTASPVPDALMTLTGTLEYTEVKVANPLVLLAPAYDRLGRRMEDVLPGCVATRLDRAIHAARRRRAPQLVGFRTYDGERMIHCTVIAPKPDIVVMNANIRAERIDFDMLKQWVSSVALGVLTRGLFYSWGLP